MREQIRSRKNLKNAKASQTPEFSSLTTSKWKNWMASVIGLRMLGDQ